MSRELLSRLLRRGTVLVATGAMIGVAVATVQVASAWRAESAPLDEAPVGLTTIAVQAEAEAARTELLVGQIDAVAGQLTTLKGALLAADGTLSDDTENATALQDQLAETKTKLEKLQAQLKGAEGRLAALNKAAARQAALNAAARTSGSPARTGPTPEPHDEPDDD